MISYQTFLNKLYNRVNAISYAFMALSFICLLFSFALIFDKQIIGFFAFCMSLLMLLFSWWLFQLERSKEVDTANLYKLWEESAAGNPISVAFNDERLHPILQKATEHGRYIEHIAIVASKLGEGDFDSYFTVEEGGSKLLNNALDSMRNKLKTIMLKEKKAKWEIEQIAKISSILEKEHSSNSMAEDIGQLLKEVLEVKCLSIWVINNINDYPTIYQPLYHDGYKISVEEDITDLCYTQSDLLIEQLNEKKQPKLLFNKSLQCSCMFKNDDETLKGRYHFMIIPLVVNKQLYGMIEIGHNKRLNAEQMRFPRLVSEKISMGFMRIKSNEHTYFLLNEAQMLTEELRQREEVLQELNKNIQKQHSKVAESINYASHIQKAIVPTEAQMQKALPNSFLLNVPKDKVSGDFPWFWENDEFVFITAADCTGHGVPGAMISMMGYFLLEQIVGDDNHEHPAIILQKLDEYMMRILAADMQFGNQISIDLGLCKLDKKQLQLDFAGAYRPLYLQTKKGFKVIKGDRKTIGGGYKHIKKKMQDAFTEHSVALEPGDSFYLFTDGYVDQFGGDKDRKLSSGQLQQLIEENKGESIFTIKQNLSGKFQDWKGLRNQTDDMLMIGIQL